jgi:hypothetical protein
MLACVFLNFQGVLNFMCFSIIWCVFVSSLVQNFRMYSVKIITSCELLEYRLKRNLKQSPNQTIHLTNPRDQIRVKIGLCQPSGSMYCMAVGRGARDGRGSHHREPMWWRWCELKHSCFTSKGDVLYRV